jgi:hypothetical protein
MRSKSDSIDKMIIFSVGSMCTYDSIGNPQLSLRTYLEYSPNKEIKIAKGDFKYVRDRNAPAYSLDKFFQINDEDSLKKLMNDNLTNSSYLDSYIQPGEGLFYVLIYKTQKYLKQIIYRSDSLPEGLNTLHSYFLIISNSRDLTTTEPFSVDSLLIQYEKQQFLKYPPPPAPALLDSTIHFIVPVVEDTIR